MFLFFALLISGTLVVFLVGWVPLRYRGIKPGAWVTTWMCRGALKIYNIRVDCTPCARLSSHRGFIFPNHISYMDILVLMSIVPVRFLAKAEVARWPLVGYLAKAIGCVFVNRSDKSSRKQARQALAGMSMYPPVVLFPEGKTGPGGCLLPFRYGAFEVAIDNQIPYIPLALVYEPYQAVAWYGHKNLLKSAWTLGSRSQPVKVRLVAYDTVFPRPGDNARELAEQAFVQIEQALIEAGQVTEPSAVRSQARPPQPEAAEKVAQHVS